MPANKPTCEFDRLSAPARRALANAGYTKLAQLAKAKEADIAPLHGMGPNTLGKLRTALKGKGLSFGPART
jgi:hypothetical protein